MNTVLFWLWGPGILLALGAWGLWITRHPKSRTEPDLFERPSRSMANSEGLRSPSKRARR